MKEETFNGHDVIDLIAIYANASCGHLEKGGFPQKVDIEAGILAVARAVDPGWIDCKVRLPEIGTQVLYTSQWESYQLGRWDGEKWLYWGIDDFDCGAWVQQWAVTHWRPLPALPGDGRKS